MSEKLGKKKIVRIMERR